MVGGRSRKLRNVPPDFLRRFRNNFGRYLVCIGDAEVGEVQAFCCILAEISRCIEIPQKCARKPKIESCEKLLGEGQDTSETSFRTSYEASGPISGNIRSASSMPKSVKFRHSAAFWLKSRDRSRCNTYQKCARKPKNERYQKWSGEGQNKSAKPACTSKEASRTISGDT